MKPSPGELVAALPPDAAVTMDFWLSRGATVRVGLPDSSWLMGKGWREPGLILEGVSSFNRGDGLQTAGWLYWGSCRWFWPTESRVT